MNTKNLCDKIALDAISNGRRVDVSVVSLMAHCNKILNTVCDAETSGRMNVGGESVEFVGLSPDDKAQFDKERKEVSRHAAALLVSAAIVLHAFSSAPVEDIINDAING